MKKAAKKPKNGGPKDPDGEYQRWCGRHSAGRINFSDWWSVFRIGYRRASRNKSRAAAASLAVMAELHSVEILQLLRDRGGHPGAVAEAVLLCVQKSADYNQGMGHSDMHTVDRDAYFPLGLASYAQMLHTKSMRLVSLSRKGGEAIHESARDTALDIINYAGFCAAWLGNDGSKK